MKDFHFGHNLKSKRQEKNLTQEYVALKLNIPQSTYFRLEQKSAIPELSFVYEIAEVLEVKPSALMPKMGDDEPAAPKKTGEDYFNEVARSPVVVFLYFVAFYFFVEWAGVVAYSFCLGLRISEKTARIVGDVLAAIVFFSMVYLGYKLWLKKWIG